MERQSSRPGGSLSLAARQAFVALCPRRIARPRVRPARRRLTVHHWQPATGDSQLTPGNCPNHLRIKYLHKRHCGSNICTPSPTLPCAESTTLSGCPHKCLEINELKIKPLRLKLLQASWVRFYQKPTTYALCRPYKPFIFKYLNVNHCGSNSYRSLSLKSIIYRQPRGRGVAYG